MSYIFKERIKEIVNGLLDGSIVVDPKGVSKNYTANVAEALAVLLETGELPTLVGSKEFTANLVQTVAELIESGEIVLPSKGTPVPTGPSGTNLRYVYLNRSMSVAEIDKVVNKIDFAAEESDDGIVSDISQAYGLPYAIVHDSSNKGLYVLKHDDGAFAILYQTSAGSAFTNKIMYMNEIASSKKVPSQCTPSTSFVGWNPDLTSDELYIQAVLAENNVNIDVSDTLNAALACIISSTPFE